MEKTEMPIDYYEPYNAWLRLKTILISEGYNFIPDLIDMQCVEQAIIELKKIKEVEEDKDILDNILDEF